MQRTMVNAMRHATMHRIAVWDLVFTFDIDIPCASSSYIIYIEEEAPLLSVILDDIGSVSSEWKSESSRPPAPLQSGNLRRMQ